MPPNFIVIIKNNYGKINIFDDSVLCSFSYDSVVFFIE
jgi:hypothetical protein